MRTYGLSVDPSAWRVHRAALAEPATTPNGKNIVVEVYREQSSGYVTKTEHVVLTTAEAAELAAKLTEAVRKAKQANDA